jgi:uncharacterized Fe-S cluster-containing radical SAM superfamily enzyme
MTPTSGMRSRLEPFDQSALAEVARFAANHGVDQVMLTGKGEPTLWPAEIDACLSTIEPFNFPHVDLQTNGILIANGVIAPDVLSRWRDRGLGLASISLVHYDPVRNREVYLPYRERYPSLASIVDPIHAAGLAVRLALVMVAGYIEDAPAFADFLSVAKSLGVEQVTARPVNRPSISRSDSIGAYVDGHTVSAAGLTRIATYLSGSRVVSHLPGNGIVYDVNGISVCLATSLTHEGPGEVHRQLIAYPDGSVATSWESDAGPLFDVI